MAHDNDRMRYLWAERGACLRCGFELDCAPEMSAILNEHALAEQLCGELLTVAELRQLCQARGFPMVGSGKEEQARSAAARLLDTRGISEVMAKLDPAWLKLLHLAKALPAPVGIDAMIQIAEPDAEDIWRYDYRAFFRKLVANLLAKGVALVHEGPSAARSNSRYARFQLIFPTSFHAELPLYPCWPSSPRISGSRRPI